LPTVVAHDDHKSPEAHLAMKARMKGGPRKTITSVQVAIKALLPTPTASDGERGVAKRYDPHAKSRSAKTLTTLVGRGTGATLRLQPAFSAWMMGFPNGWCDFPTGLGRVDNYVIDWRYDNHQKTRIERRAVGEAGGAITSPEARGAGTTGLRAPAHSQWDSLDPADRRPLA
jgi:hypothetical protein